MNNDKNTCSMNNDIFNDEVGTLIQGERDVILDWGLVEFSQANFRQQGLALNCGRTT